MLFADSFYRVAARQVALGEDLKMGELTVLSRGPQHAIVYLHHHCTPITGEITWKKLKDCHGLLLEKKLETLTDRLEQ